MALNKIQRQMLDDNVVQELNGLGEQLADTVQKKTIYVSQYPIISPEADDTQRIIRAIADCVDGDKIVLKGNFTTSSKITVNKSLEWDSKNAVITSNHSGVCIEFSHATRTNFGDGESYSIKAEFGALKKSTRDHADSSVGVQIVNSYFGEFRFSLLDGFTTQLRLKGTTLNGSAKGTVYNSFKLGRLQNHKIGLELVDDLSGWVTENSFYGGSFGGVGEKHVFINGGETSRSNNNKFYSPSFEGTHTIGVEGINTVFNSFYEPRFEMPQATYLIDWKAGTQSNRIIAGYGFDSASITKFSDVGRYNRLSSSGYLKGSFEYYDKTYYALTPFGSTINTSLSGQTVIPLGATPTQQITTSSEILSIDVSKARFFRVMVNNNINALTIDNIPANFLGQKITVEFIQNASGGYLIDTTVIKHGTTSATPVQRSYGRDIYELIYDGSFYVLSQFSL